MFAEEWKDISDYENYEVSNLGNIRNKKTRRVLKSYNKGGYAVVGLSKTKGKIFPVHRLVCQAFIPNPENKPQVNHIDKNGLNNNVTNLEWNSVLENNIHRSNGVIQTTNQQIPIYRVDENTNEKLEQSLSYMRNSKETLEKENKEIKKQMSSLFYSNPEYNHSLVLRLFHKIYHYYFF